MTRKPSRKRKLFYSRRVFALRLKIICGVVIAKRSDAEIEADFYAKMSELRTANSAKGTPVC